MRRLLVATGLVAGSVFVAVPAQAGGGCHADGARDAAGATVELAMNCMNPRVLRTSSEEITFVNRDGATHNLFGSGWMVEELRTDDTVVRRFSEGTHVYSCTLHPGMVGAIVVGDGVAETSLRVAAVRPVAAESKSASDRLPLGLAVGAIAGVLLTIAARRVH